MRLNPVDVAACIVNAVLAMLTWVLPIAAIGSAFFMLGFRFLSWR